MKSNFHTHSTYCDGRNSCEETVIKAIEKGFEAIGFSGHSYTAFADDYCMSIDGTELYRRDVNSLKAKYEGKIRIYCGLELDYLSENVPGGWDYIIGSVHFLYKDGRYICLDGCAGNVIEAIDMYYGGDADSYAEDYYNAVSNVVNKTNCDIIGHFDLITKFDEQEHIFNENSERYIAAWKKAIDALIETGKPFEVNTGAMSRGYRKTPYPSKEQLKYIAQKGGRVVLTTDCHNADMLDYGENVANSLINETGVECIDFEDILLKNK